MARGVGNGKVQLTGGVVCSSSNDTIPAAQATKKWHAFKMEVSDAAEVQSTADDIALKAYSYPSYGDNTRTSGSHINSAPSQSNGKQRNAAKAESRTETFTTLWPPPTRPS